MYTMWYNISVCLINWDEILNITIWQQVKPECIFNCDESGFSFLFDEVCVNDTSVKYPYELDDITRNQITALCCASALGSLLHPMLVFPGNVQLQSSIHKQFPEAMIKSTSNGRISSSFFIEVFYFTHYIFVLGFHFSNFVTFNLLFFTKLPVYK